MQQNTASPENLEVLDALALQRHLLASKMGYPSYAHYFLADKMAKTPTNVERFVHNVKDQCMDQYQQDVAMLTRIKHQMEGNSEELHAWDWSHYTGLVKTHLFEDVGTEEGGGTSLNGYFTVDQSIEGMKYLVHKLFGIIMEEVPLRSNECWDLDSTTMNNSSSSRIQKLKFYREEDEEPLGTMYLDLYPREGKYNHSAHFTVRCGCKLRNDSSEEEYQLPIVALVCNLSPMFTNLETKAILSHSEVVSVILLCSLCLRRVSSNIRSFHTNIYWYERKLFCEFFPFLT
jgi:intermediate peptidase